MEEKIEKLIKEPIEKEGLIDKENEYITVNDCVTVNNLLDPILDEIDFIKDSYIVDICSKEKGEF